jgi:hypothetical protein
MKVRVTVGEGTGFLKADDGWAGPAGFEFRRFSTDGGKAIATHVNAAIL